MEAFAKASVWLSALPRCRWHVSEMTPAATGAVSNLCPAGHRLESTVGYLGIEVDDALEIAEQTEV